MIGILIPNNLWFCPYVNIYTNILVKEQIPYEIVSWCRDGKNEKGCIQYKDTKKHNNAIGRLLSYFRYALFVKKIVKQRQYKKLIVFTPQLAIFIAGFLKHEYKGRYIFDYRDLSIEQKTFFKRPFLIVLKNSVANVISSPGFKKYLPSDFDYILSHNFNIDIVRKMLNRTGETCISFNKDHIDVLTIGGIRDYDSNVQVINSLYNKPNFTIRFVGKGPSAKALHSHSQNIVAKNIYFEGYYPKELEAKYIEECTFMNIFYPRLPSHDSALSNRFYNSLIYKRPMITTAETTQGDLALKFGLGVAVKNCDNLDNDLISFLQTMDEDLYVQRCNFLLSSFVDDYERFEYLVKEFISCP